MPETFDNANQAPGKIPQEFLMKFWHQVRELHGPLSEDFAASKSNALQLFQRLSYAPSEDEAIRMMRQDREGTLSLFWLTVFQANLDGWAVTLETINIAKTPIGKMDLNELRVPKAGWFFRRAIDGAN